VNYDNPETLKKEYQTSRQTVSAHLLVSSANKTREVNWFTSFRWLTDQEIDWALEQTINQLPYQLTQKHKILETTQFMFAKEATSLLDPEARFSFPVLLSELTGFSRNLVFIPVNNPNFHWSLLVYEKSTQTFYHWDTLPGSPNHGYIKPLVRDLLQQLQQNNQPDLDKYLVLRDEIKQPNTWDCGIAVIEITRQIMEKYAGKLNDFALNNIDLTQARNDWRQKWEQNQQMAQIVHNPPRTK